jgi:hypothetical protein
MDDRRPTGAARAPTAHGHRFHCSGDLHHRKATATDALHRRHPRAGRIRHPKVDRIRHPRDASPRRRPTDARCFLHPRRMAASHHHRPTDARYFHHRRHHRTDAKNFRPHLRPRANHRHHHHVRRPLHVHHHRVRKRSHFQRTRRALSPPPG